MKTLDIPKSGKCGNMVWQRNRYAQYCYPAFIPANPRTPAQVVVRTNFGAVSKRWRTITEEQRLIWNAVAWTMMSKPRLYQCGRLTGCRLFVKVNVALANRGIPQVDLPPGYLHTAEPGVSSPSCATRLDQIPLGPLLFLQAHQLLDGWQHHRREFVADHPT